MCVFDQGVFEGECFNSVFKGVCVCVFEGVCSYVCVIVQVQRCVCVCV